VEYHWGEGVEVLEGEEGDHHQEEKAEGNL
jgi:hypothetical protein